MPENVMLNHNYVMAEGGTGVRALLAAHMYLSAKAYATGGNGTENWKFIYETMDAGAEEIEQLQKLVRLDEESGFCNPHYSFHFCRLAEKVKEKLAGDNTMSLEKIAPEWYRNGLLLTKEELERDLLGGYYRDLTLGSVISAAAMQCALETVEDRNAGFRAIANDVVASNNTYETRVVMVGSGIGGEGRTNLCTHPAMLRKLCVERVMKDLRMEQKQAKAYVEQNLKIAVIMTGSAFRFPAMNGLDQDVAGLVAGTLRNFPEDSAEAVNLFYLLEHDQCPVQATKASDSREQYKHAHAIELVAVAAMEDFFGLGTKHASKKHCPVIPHYSRPGNALTNWENLGLPEEYRQYLSARLRFDAALFYWLRPQLILEPEEKNSDKIYEAEILARMFRKKTSRQVKEAVLSSGMDLEEEIVEPLKALLAKETMFLEYLGEISLTGKNWETDSTSAYGSTLFDTERIEEMTGKEIGKKAEEKDEEKIEKKADISEHGGMKGFQFDELTMCPVDRRTGQREENIYNTRLTMDELRKQVKYFEHGNPRPFQDILRDIYEICSERKERRHYGIF